EEYGGAGADTVAYAIAVEELTRVDSSVAITMAAHHSLGTLPIYNFGSEEQKQQWLPDLASGRKLAAFGLTEPDAGSDAGASRTRTRTSASSSGSRSRSSRPSSSSSPTWPPRSRPAGRWSTRPRG